MYDNKNIVNITEWYFAEINGEKALLKVFIIANENIENYKKIYSWTIRYLFPDCVVAYAIKDIPDLRMFEMNISLDNLPVKKITACVVDKKNIETSPILNCKNIDVSFFEKELGNYRLKMKI